LIRKHWFTKPINRGRLC